MIGRENVLRSLSAALCKRAPRSDRTVWYMEIADTLGVSDDTIQSWVYGKNAPELHYYFALCKLFGHEFAQEVQGSLTDIHCSAEPSVLQPKLAEASQLAEQLADVLSAVGNGKFKRIK